jgi:hypothetical protein
MIQMEGKAELNRRLVGRIGGYLGKIGQRMIDIGDRVINNEGIMDGMDRIIGLLKPPFLNGRI